MCICFKVIVFDLLSEGRIMAGFRLGCVGATLKIHSVCVSECVDSLLPSITIRSTRNSITDRKDRLRGVKASDW